MKRQTRGQAALAKVTEAVFVLAEAHTLKLAMRSAKRRNAARELKVIAAMAEVLRAAGHQMLLTAWLPSRAEMAAARRIGSQGDNPIPKLRDRRTRAA